MINENNLTYCKVPLVTIGFWIIKIIATTLGELGGNTLSMTLNFGYLVSSIIFLVPLFVITWMQIRAKQYNSLLYWGTITLTTLAGTTMADFFDRSLGIGYAGGSTALFLFVLATLWLWNRSLGSVNIKTITNPKVEIFYWTTIIFSQTLGTALGDWMADSTPLGYRGSVLLITAVLVALSYLYYFTKVSRTTLFWAAFILTRPLGATIANSLDKPVSHGGLGINDITATAIFAFLMLSALTFIPQKQGHH